MSDLFVIFISTCLVNNLALNHLLGLPPGIALARKLEIAVGLSLTMMIVLPVTSAAAYPVMRLILIPLGMEYLELVGQMFIIALVVTLVEVSLRRLRPGWYERIGVFFPLLFINSAVLGTVLINNRYDHGLASSLFFGLGSGAGYGLVIIMLSALEERLAAADIPRPFQGISIILITLGIMSMAFMGFTGLVTP